MFTPRTTMRPSVGHKIDEVMDNILRYTKHRCCYFRWSNQWMYDNVFIECRELEIVSWHWVNSGETKHNSHVLMSSKIKTKKPSFWRFSKSSFYYKKMSLENVFTIVAKPLHYMLTNWICKFVRLFQTYRESFAFKI